MQMSAKDLQKLTQTLREIQEFMIVDGKPEKDRQKLMRNLRVRAKFYGGSVQNNFHRHFPFR